MSSRVTQLDVLDLDSYTTDLLIRKEVDKCMRLFSSPVILQLKPYVQTALYATLLYHTVGKYQQTVAQRLFGVIMTDTQNPDHIQRWKILCYIAAEAFGFLWSEKYDAGHPDFLSSWSKTTTIVNFIHNIARVSRLCNFLLFLNKGQFSRLLLLALGLKVCAENPGEVGDVSYTILGREILWRGFAEILVETITQFDLSKIRRYIAKGVATPTDHNDGNALLYNIHFINSYIQLALDVARLKQCCVCSEWPTQPHESNCGHVGCYYCMSVCIVEGGQCPTCSSTISNIKMVGYV